MAEVNESLGQYIAREGEKLFLARAAVLEEQRDKSPTRGGPARPAWTKERIIDLFDDVIQELHDEDGDLVIPDSTYNKLIDVYNAMESYLVDG